MLGLICVFLRFWFVQFLVWAWRFATWTFTFSWLEFSNYWLCVEQLLCINDKLNKYWWWGMAFSVLSWWTISSWVRFSEQPSAIWNGCPTSLGRLKILWVPWNVAEFGRTAKNNNLFPVLCVQLPCFQPSTDEGLSVTMTENTTAVG